MLKRPHSPSQNNRPSKRQATYSPEDGELEEPSDSQTTPLSPPPQFAPQKFKIPFPFKKASNPPPAIPAPYSVLQPSPPPPRSPTRSPSDTPPRHQHRLPPRGTSPLNEPPCYPRDSYRSPPRRSKGVDRYVPSYDERHPEPRRGHERDRRGMYHSGGGYGHEHGQRNSRGYDSWRPGNEYDGRRDGHSRSRSRERSPLPRSTSPLSRPYRSRSPRGFSPPSGLPPRPISPPRHLNFSPPSNAPPPPPKSPPPPQALPSQRSSVKIPATKPHASLPPKPDFSKPPPPPPPSNPPPLPAPVPKPSQPSQPHPPQQPLQPKKPKRAPILRSSEAEGRAYNRTFTNCSSIGAYSITTKVGEGTFGEVHKATHNPTGEPVALKRILMHNEKEGMPITALREIRILKKLRHPNVVHLREVVVQGGMGVDGPANAGSGHAGGPRSFHMVFPYMDHDLAGLLENERVTMNPSQIKLYMKQLLEGTAYLHANRIVHRDMKAANLLISNTGLLQIADFGLARAFDPNLVNQGKRSGEDSNITRYTNCVVTRWYRPPELFLGARRYGGEIDIWGIGCVLGEMFTRRPILMGNSDINQLDLIWQLCGSPSANENWTDYNDLPGIDGITRFPKYERKIKERFVNAGAETVDLLERLLTLDPSRRITALDALDHAWFWTDPLPADPKALPKYESSHEIDKRVRRQAAPPQMPPMPSQPMHQSNPTVPHLPPPMSKPQARHYNPHRQNQPYQHQGRQGPPSQQNWNAPQGAPPYPPHGGHFYGPPIPQGGPPGFMPPAPGWNGPPPQGQGWPPQQPQQPHHNNNNRGPRGDYYRPDQGGGRGGPGNDYNRGRGGGERRQSFPPPGTNGLPPKPVVEMLGTGNRRNQAGGRGGGREGDGGRGDIGGPLPYD